MSLKTVVENHGSHKQPNPLHVFAQIPLPPIRFGNNT